MTLASRVMLRKFRYDRLSEMLLPAHVPAPMVRVNPKPLSNPPPVPKQCPWLTSTRATRSRSATCRARAFVGGVDPTGVSGPLKVKDVLDSFESFVEIVKAVDGQDDGQLLSGKGSLRAEAVLLHHEELSLLCPNVGQARHQRNGGGWLCGDLGIELAIHPHHRLKAPLLLRAEEVAAFGLECCDGGVVDTLVDVQGVLRRTTGGVVKNLAGLDLCGGAEHVRAGIDDHRGVSHADTDRRFAAAVGSMDVLLRASHDRQVTLTHELVRVRLGRPRQELDQVAGRSPPCPARRACSQPVPPGSMHPWGTGTE